MIGKQIRVCMYCSETWFKLTVEKIDNEGIWAKDSLCENTNHDHGFPGGFFRWDELHTLKVID